MTIAELKKELELFMDNTYQGCEPDLPRAGNWHFVTAIDFVADRASDMWWKKNQGELPKSINLKAIATKVVRQYAGNDSGWSRRKEKALERQWARMEKQPRKRKEPRVKQWDDYPPRNKGIGSL